MKFSTLETHITWAKAHAPKGLFTFIFAQDDIELTHTVAHHIRLGFRQMMVLADIPVARSEDLPAEVAFNTEERRKTIPMTVVDLYAGHLGQSPDGVDVTNTYLDRLGYYTETRRDGEQAPLPQQFNFYGGLRWRFEEHVP